MKNLLYLIGLFLFTATSCTVVKPGQVGIKQRLGKLSDKVKDQGPVFYNPFTSKVLKTSIQTTNLELALNLPSKEGLSIMSQISILYRLERKRVPELINNLGTDYESVIANVFRSASADVCSQFFAKDMHSGMRADIEAAILKRMNDVLQPKGIVTESVLMKSIQLPAGLSKSIEQKLQAEQDAMRMEFVLQQEKLEADRKIIQAKGTRDAQKIMAEGLTPEIIKIRSIEAFSELARSPNSKIIMTNGSAPFLIEDK